MKKLSCFGLLLVAAIGCGGKSDSNQSQVAGQPDSPKPSATAAVAGSSTTLVANGATTEPGEVVALFLDSLRRGDEATANSVLTKQAQTELAKTDYVIEPLGTPEGKFAIGRVGFVDAEKTTGLVECTWSEPNPEVGQPPISMEIVCEVHKEEAGWRISGLAVKMTGTEETFVLDFENAQSLQSALESANGQPTTTQTAATQTTAAPATNFPDSAQMPPLPAGLPPAAPNQPATQIALPPLPTINR